MSSLHQSHHDEDTDKREMMKRRVTIILPESGPEIRSMARLDNDVHLEPEKIASSPVDHVSQLDRAKCSINHKNKTMIQHKKSHLQDKTNAKAAANQIRTSDPTITATRKWQIHPDGLAPFPESHHLHNSAQRTRTTLLVLPSKGNVTTIHSATAAAQDVLDRISNFMRAQSMEGTFDARTNSIHGRLSQCGFLHFVIHLWRMNDSNNNDNSSSSSSDMMRSSAVVVEFQRQRGCGIGARRIRQSLFAALQSQNGDENSIITTPSLSAGLLWKKFPLATVLKRKQQHDIQKRRAATGKTDVTKDECFEQALAMCYQLLMPSENDCQRHQNIYDQSHRLGLEQLLYLSKPCENNNSSSSVIAQGIVWNQGPHASWLQTCLVRYFVQQSDNCHLYNHNSTTEAMEMGQLALNILTNALVIATTSMQCRSSDAGDDGDARLFCSEFWHTCAAHWRDNLRQQAAANGPHNAAMSAQCIRLLHELSSQHQQSERHSCQKNDENDNQWILDDVFLADLLRAHAYGQAHHLELAVQTRQLIQHCLGGGGLM